MKISYAAIALAFAAQIFGAQCADAGVLQLETGAKQLNGITISTGGKMAVEGRTSNLITMGAGVRTALFGAVKAYVGEFLVNDSKAYVCDKSKALDSLANLSAVAMHVSVTFSFDKSKLLAAFNDGFSANDVNPDDADIQKFLALVQAGGDAPKGSTFNFLGERLPDGSEAVTYEDPAGKATTLHGKSGFVRNIFSLWLGNTDDSGLKDLNGKLQSCQI
jgi:hypothetical protein